MELDQPHNLPAQSSSFLGRERELAELERLLGAPEVRMLTLWGPGGIGKTRLAIEAAARCGDRFADGAAFVPLHALRSAGELPAALAAALAIPLISAAAPLEQMLAALRERRLLLVLDNCEQLGEGVALFSRLLAAAPGLTLLATSREALRLHEEWLFPLGGLPVPSGAADADADALRLFVERARQARYDLALEQEREAASEICRLVDGMPLALELAAAWTRTLSCAAIVAELRRGLDLLAGGLRNLPERHRSLRAVCEQSWVLLDAAEQRAFARLSLFRAGFSAAAAGAVAGADLPLLDVLVSKSLVRRAEGGRYQIHELLRQYGAERLREDGGAEARAAAGRFYVALLESWFPPRIGQAISPAALAAIEPELENIREAWGDILDQCDGEALQRVAQLIQNVYFVRGPYQEGSALVEEAIRRLRERPLTPERGVAIADGLNSLGWFRLRQGRIAEARRRFTESAELYGELGRPRPAGDGTEPLGGLGVIALVEGDYREAVRLGMAAIQRAEAEAHPGNELNGLYLLVRAALLQGQYRVAERYAQRMEALVHELDSRWFAAYSQIELGNIAVGLGAYTAARGHYEAAYALREEYGDPEGMAAALAAQGRAALLAGEAAEAGRLYERSLAIYEYLGDQGGLAGALDGLGRTLTARGAYGQAREALRRALGIAAERGFTPLQLALLTGVAELLAVAGRQGEGLPLLRLVAQHPAADGETARRAQALLAGATQPPSEPPAAKDNDLALAVAGALRALAAIPQGAGGAQRGIPAVGGLVESLSEREREILVHIAAGRSNQEIADLLIYAVGTVKWYTAQIYGKLAVKSRTQAIARARELGLLT